ncbi:MAG: DUF378 domain-containing protein [Clostridiales bacterium]|nr:DUF378 domain-containing protein [Clostridiales bacterium]
MFRLFAFIFTCLGGLNWLMIGALQYDFIAGIFGTQANIFSRLIYVVIGVFSLYILIVTVFSKGRLKLFGYKKKKPVKTQEEEY